MSELKDQVLQDMEKEMELDRKKAVIEENRITVQHARIEQSKKDLELIKNSTFGPLSNSEIDKLVKNNDEYIEGARHAMLFVNEEFRNVVPFFRKNLILIGGKTGEGKSTTVANIILETIRQVNPLTGKKRRVLVLSNEEKPEDVYNRVTCLIKGWSYVNHDKFTDEMVLTFRKYIPLLAKDGLLTVIDNSYGGVMGMTTTIEGIKTIFDNLIRDGEYYDVIIIDYYQKINMSKEDPTMADWQVQAKLADMLDNYKNVYPAPIVVMAQVKPPGEDNSPFEHRIKGRKVITDPATLIMEMVAEREHLRTKWVVHKSRFTGSVGADFYTGFDQGRFVEYDNEFMAKVLKIKEDRQKAAFNKASGADLKERQEKLEKKDE